MDPNCHEWALTLIDYESRIHLSDTIHHRRISFHPPMACVVFGSRYLLYGFDCTTIDCTSAYKSRFSPQVQKLAHTVHHQKTSHQPTSCFHSSQSYRDEAYPTNRSIVRGCNSTPLIICGLKLNDFDIHSN